MNPLRARLTVERLDDRCVPAVFHWAFDGSGAGAWDYAPNWAENEVPTIYDTLVFPAGSTNCNFLASQNELTEVAEIICEEDWEGYIACKDLTIHSGALSGGEIRVYDGGVVDFDGTDFRTAFVSADNSVVERMLRGDNVNLIGSVSAVRSNTRLIIPRTAWVNYATSATPYIWFVDGEVVVGRIGSEYTGTLQIRNDASGGGTASNTRMIAGSGTIRVTANGVFDIFSTTSGPLYAQIDPRVIVEGGTLSVRSGLATTGTGSVRFKGGSSTVPSIQVIGGAFDTTCYSSITSDNTIVLQNRSSWGLYVDTFLRTGSNPSLWVVNLTGDVELYGSDVFLDRARINQDGDVTAYNSGVWAILPPQINNAYPTSWNLTGSFDMPTEDCGLYVSYFGNTQWSGTWVVIDAGAAVTYNELFAYVNENGDYSYNGTTHQHIMSRA
jgi:hypothetical protein